jgi:hypothetical protein
LGIDEQGSRTSKGMSLRTPLCSIVLMALLMAALPLSAAENETVEYAVKAAYLYKFGGFIEWPPTAFDAPSSAVNLCVAGEDPFGSKLDEVTAKQHIGGREIVVRHIKGTPRGGDCQILFVGGADAKSVTDILRAVRGAGVLTVTDADVDGDSIIHFVTADNHVRFVIDEKAAAQNGIVVSSKLLHLALAVTPRN